jgi:prepilin-type N-terminal cleavage/methylation domain-containing protein
MKYTFSAKAFTLIELLIVISIIGLLTGVVIASTAASRAKARDGRRIEDMKQIQLGLALYYDVNKVYPAGSDVSALNVLATQKYLPSIPTDPAGGVYQYLSINSNKGYCFGVNLDSTIPSDNVTHAINSGCDPLTSNYKAQNPN